MTATRVYDNFETKSGSSPYTSLLTWYPFSATVALSTSYVTEGSNNWLVSSSSTIRIESPYHNLTYISSVSLDFYSPSASQNIYLTILEDNGRGYTYTASISNLSVGYNTISLNVANILALYPSFDLSNCLIRIELTKASGTRSIYLNKLYLNTNTNNVVHWRSWTATGTTNATVSYRAAINDFLVLFVETANQSVTTPSGWTQFANGSQGTGTAGGTSATKLSAYYKISDGTDTSVSASVTGGDHVYALVLGLWNQSVSSPIDVAGGDVEASSSTSVSFPAVTTSSPGCFILNCTSYATDASTNTLSSISNTNLSDIKYIGSGGTTIGNGGGVSVVSGVKSTAGSTGNTTATLSSASAQGKITIAIAPEIALGAGDVNKTLANISLSSSTKLSLKSVLNKTLTNISLSSTAKLSLKSVLNKTLESISLSSSNADLTELNKTLTNISLSSTAKLSLKSVLNKTLESIQSSIQSIAVVDGELNKTLDNITSQSAGVPWSYRYGESNITLGDLTCSSSEYIEILFEDYFTPAVGYEIYHTNIQTTKPEIIYYSQNYASLYDTPQTALGSYGEVPTFKIIYTITCHFQNIIDNNIKYTEKKSFKVDVKPNWSAIRDNILKSYFEGSLINNMTPAEFIEYMKSQGYYQ